MWDCSAGSDEDYTGQAHRLREVYMNSIAMINVELTVCLHQKNGLLAEKRAVTN